MASPDMIDSSVVELIESLQQHCPQFAPSIFPMSFNPRSLNQLCIDEKHTQKLMKKWKALHSGSDSTQIIFKTLVDYRRREIRIIGLEAVSDEVDYLLSNLERCIELLIKGQQVEVNIAIARFLSLNGHNGEIAVEKYRFNEAYNLAYTIKVLVSNTPMKVLWGLKGSICLPFDRDTDNFDDAIDAVLNQSKKRPVEDDDDDEDDMGGDGSSSKKRRKKKRAGGGKGKNN